MLHAFANVCRHRGHELLPCGGSAQKRGIVCPYHAWSLPAGRLAARARRASATSRASIPSSSGWSGCPAGSGTAGSSSTSSGRAGYFADHLGALEGIVAPYAPGELTVLATHEYEIAANWKIIVENYQECYHCSMIHPELCQVSPPESGANLDLPGDWVGGWMSLRDEADTMSLDGGSRWRP